MIFLSIVAVSFAYGVVKVLLSSQEPHRTPIKVKVTQRPNRWMN